MKAKEQFKTTLIALSAVFVLIGVFAMRWNVVIGGQLISKSLRGLTTFAPPLLGPGGLLVTIAFLILPFVIFAVISYLLPPWAEEVKQQPERRGFRLAGSSLVRPERR
ncbi:MAG: hypothetical protein HY670_06155 [Chloroflexi bacterium]|nr:hypothetical protein [Chloroflexota bacterium]